MKINQIPVNSEKKDWADYTFRQMPVAAVLPLLSKFQWDAKLSETSLLNYLANKIAAKPVHDEYKEEYSYKVGERSVAVAADKMNVFYVGVENPLTISVAGIPSNEVVVSADGVDIRRKGNGKYMVIPARPGKTIIKVSGGGLPVNEFEYRIKRIPNPIAKLGNKLSGTMSANEFKIYKKIDSHLEQFDFDAKCKIINFELVRVDKNGDGFVNKNSGNKFDEKSLRMVNAAKRGDQYFFENIKAKCPGDRHSRKLNALFFKIK